MKLEKIGIGELKDRVLKKPEKYARLLIAPMVLKLLAKETRQRNLINGPRSIVDAVITADKHPTEAQIAIVSKIVTEILQQYDAWPELRTSIDHESLSRIGRACMHLLGDWLHGEGQVELAHHIHAQPHVSPQRARLGLLDHNIIPDNRIFHGWGNGNEWGDNFRQLWSGHETEAKYSGSKKKEDINIIVLFTNNQGSQDVQPILRGQSIKIFGDQVLVFRDEKIYVHNGPEMGIDDFPLLSEFPCVFESIENIEYLKTKSEWHMYRITGTKNIEEVNEESTSITSSITLCVHEDRPELSYSTTSKRFLMGGNGFTVDTTNGVIIAFTRGDTVRIPYSEIHGMKKEGNGEEYFVFNQDGIQKKLTFSSGNPEVLDIAE